MHHQSKSLDEDDTVDDYIDKQNYKTTRSQSMATVEFGNRHNHNRVPMRWKDANANTSNRFSRNFNMAIKEEPIQKQPTDIPTKSYSPIKEYDRTSSNKIKAIHKNLISRQDSMNSSDLRDRRRSLSRTRQDETRSPDRKCSVERNEKHISGVTPATAYQQYTFARSKNSLN
jgi:hypothetical protein